MNKKFVVGIDISKAKIDVSLFDNERHQLGQFSNDEAGFERLSRWLVKRDAADAPVCMEATGRYWEKLAHYLYEHKHDVSVLNPLIIKRYGESLLQRNKTDQLDAKLIARYLYKEEPYLWHPPEVVRSQLQALTRYLNELLRKRTREINQLESNPASEFVRQAVKETIAYLEDKIAATEAEIATLRDQDEQLKKDHQLLTSIPGIADRSAFIILAEMPLLDELTSAKQLTAYAGLTPQQLQSGKMHKQGGVIKLGCKRLRCALYYPALVGRRFNPILEAFSDNLLASGKAKMTVVAACMRKLLVLIYGILKHRKPFDPDYLVNLRNTA